MHQHKFYNPISIVKTTNEISLDETYHEETKTYKCKCGVFKHIVEKTYFNRETIMSQTYNNTVMNDYIKECKVSESRMNKPI